MPTDDREVLRALTVEAAALRDSLGGAPNDVFDRATRCMPWTVREVLAHVLVACHRLPDALAEGPAGAVIAPSEYFRADDRFSPDANAARVAAAQRDAARFRSGAELVDGVVAAVGRMVTLAAGEPAERPVRTRWGDAMTLDGFLATRVVDLAVHGIDIARSLAVGPWTTAEAAAVALGVLVEGDPGDSLGVTGWDAVELLERATGRRPLTDDDRRRARIRSLAFG